MKKKKKQKNGTCAPSCTQQNHIASTRATGFQIVQAISEQQCLFFILNGCNFSSSCGTENYNGQHLISIVFLPTPLHQSIICFSYHKSFKLWLAVSNFESLIRIWHDLPISHYFPRLPNMRSGLCFSISHKHQPPFAFPYFTHLGNHLFFSYAVQTLCFCFVLFWVFFDIKSSLTSS